MTFDNPCIDGGNLSRGGGGEISDGACIRVGTTNVQCIRVTGSGVNEREGGSTCITWTGDSPITVCPDVVVVSPVECDGASPRPELAFLTVNGDPADDHTEIGADGDPAKLWICKDDIIEVQITNFFEDPSAVDPTPIEGRDYFELMTTMDIFGEDVSQYASLDIDTGIITIEVANGLSGDNDGAWLYAQDLATEEGETDSCLSERGFLEWYNADRTRRPMIEIHRYTYNEPNYYYDVINSSSYLDNDIGPYSIEVTVEDRVNHHDEYFTAHLQMSSANPDRMDLVIVYDSEAPQGYETELLIGFKAKYQCPSERVIIYFKDVVGGVITEFNFLQMSVSALRSGAGSYEQALTRTFDFTFRAIVNGNTLDRRFSTNIGTYNWNWYAPYDSSDLCNVNAITPMSITSEEMRSGAQIGNVSCSNIARHDTVISNTETRWAWSDGRAYFPKDTMTGAPEIFEGYKREDLRIYLREEVNKRDTYNEDATQKYALYLSSRTIADFVLPYDSGTKIDPAKYYVGMLRFNQGKSFSDYYYEHEEAILDTFNGFYRSE